MSFLFLHTVPYSVGGQKKERVTNCALSMREAFKGKVLFERDLESECQLAMHRKQHEHEGGNCRHVGVRLSKSEASDGWHG